MQRTNQRCRALVQKAGTYSSSNAVNRKNTRTIGKHREVVDKPLYKCIIEGLMHVTALYHGTRTKVHEIQE